MKAIYLIFLLLLFRCTEETRVVDEKQKTKSNQYTSLKLDKSSRMMNEDKFWNLVESALRKTNNQDEQERYLVHELQKLSNQEIIGFRLRTDYLLYNTYNSKMWCAAYIMNDGCSDDCFEYFRNWVISRGKETYYKAKENPDSLINEIVEGRNYYEFESFWYVALKAFKKNTGKELYDYINYDDFTTHEGKYPHIKFNWQEEKPETMSAITPNLYRIFFNKK